MTEAQKGHAAMMLFSLLVAGSFALGGLVANELAPTALNAVRFAIAGLLIGAAALATGGVPRAAFVAPWRYFVLGGLFATYFVLMFEGLKTAPPVSAAAVFTLTPILSAFAGWFLLRQVMTPRMAVALAIGGVGALWVIFQADLSALLAFEVGRGELIYFIGCVAHAIYTPMIVKLNRGERPLVFSLGTIWAGFLVIVIWGAGDIAAVNWLALPVLVWVAIVYVAVFASAVTFVLVQFATMRLPSAKVMAYTYLTPSWVILWEIALGNAAPPIMVALGVTLTVIALLLLLKSETV